MQPLRKPIPAEHLALVQEVFEVWAKEHQIDLQKVSDEIKMLAARINSWIDRRSVWAGVHDVMAFMPYKFKDVPRDKIEKLVVDLAEKMVKAILDNNVLTASLRRGAGLGA